MLLLENTLERSLGSKEIQPVHPKGNQSWIFTGRTDAEAETPTLWPTDAKSWLIWKDRDGGKDWRWEDWRRLAGKDWRSSSKLQELVMDREAGHALVQRGRKESNMNEQLNWIDAEAEAPIHWPPNAKNWLTGKDPDAGKDWRLEKKGTTEDEIVGWHHQLNGHEFEQNLGDGEEQGRLVCCSPQGFKELDMT